MLISPEIQERMEKDEEFLQKSAVVLIRYLTAEDGYKLGFEEVATKLRVPSRKLLEWITYDSPSIAECWKIIHTAADEYLVPVEWVIRGEVLDEYNIQQRIPLYRSFIEKAVARLKKEGKEDEDDFRLDLVVEDGFLAFFGLLTETGPFRISVGLRFLGEDIQASCQRISPKDDGAVGGIFDIQMPANAIALNEKTLPVYDRHYDHSLTVVDLKELARWIDEGRVVDYEYVRLTWEKGWIRDFDLEPAEKEGSQTNTVAE